MLYLDLVKNLADQLSDQNATRSFMEAVEIRQRMFRTHRSNVCILDPYDLFSDHLMIRRRDDGRIVSYMRVTSASACRKHDLPYPIESLKTVSPGFSESFSRFMSEAGEALHMGYMCMSPELRAELPGVKLVEFYAYLGFRCSGYPLDRVALSATLNTKYNQDPWVKDVGPWIEGAQDFRHPVIPETHRVVLIPRVRENYWPDQNAKFEALYNSLKWDNVEELSSRPKAA